MTAMLIADVILPGPLQKWAWLTSMGAHTGGFVFVRSWSMEACRTCEAPFDLLEDFGRLQITQVAGTGARCPRTCTVLW